MNRVTITGLSLCSLSRREFFEAFGGGAVYPLNVDVIMQSRRNPALRAALDRAEFLICDSQIILLASRFLGTPIKEKLSGSDLLGELCEYHRADSAVRMFLLGAAHGVADEAAQRLNARAGRRIVVGTCSPSFGFEDDPDECEQIIGTVRASGASMLVVALGVPKQELFIARVRALLPEVGRFMAVGATLDFEAGRIRRAPAWMSRAGLEWLYRLLAEPRRLWRRYLLENPPFLALVLAQKLGLHGTRPSRGGPG